jgi:AcrR family transcriptional regulator
MATRELLATSGYAALTFSDVAARAGVGRQLLYRWWPTKQDLVAEAVFERTDDLWPPEYAGPLERDLRAFVTSLVAYACRPDVRAGVVGLMADLRSRSGPLPAVREGFFDPLQRSFAALLAAGRARGDVREDVDDRMVLETIRSAITQHVMDGRRSRRTVIDHVVGLFAPALAPSQ